MKQPASTDPSAPSDTATQPSAVLDVADGLDRIMGDRALYFKLLQRFQYDYRRAIPSLREALGADRYGAARVLAHTLKGAAGMIGAHTVHTTASELESAVRAQALQLDDQLDHLELALTQVLGAINGVLHQTLTEPPPAARSQPDTADPANLVLVGRLAYLLQEGDGAAIDVLENSATVLAAMLGVEVFQKVAAAAHQFDFEGALLALRQRH